MVAGVFEELATRSAQAALHHRHQRRRDPHEPSTTTPRSTSSRRRRVRAVFFGLGSDGTVGANKNSIKIIGDETDLHAQGYFVYDSKKSGSRPSRTCASDRGRSGAPYLISPASFVACHQFGLLERFEVLDRAAHGADVPAQLSRTSRTGLGRAAAHGAGEDPRQADQALRDRRRHDRARGRHGRAHQHRHADLLLRDLRRAAARAGDRGDQGPIEKTYGKRGEEVVKRNFEAVDRSLAALHEVPVPGRASSTLEPPPSSFPPTRRSSCAR